ncbi:queuine tRNA-ribosyltransferase [Thermosporothrix hazakensis]|uniref:Queuine tRNA-ribosyltransferase n=1 Tax=Thermosporothrix hazakensis TaxID=644383 RepID=A0A326TQT7_THEHA|nr:tRNA guanosine(34) transglycosylase Tgt [Thermosporothrix hazakensis]PZW18328.1 queuine tRNA-ribosyltransferase [Thermosporothrix hazakensis]GCE48429.1 queuine tRNA-ribosyltransferase [Thermosporothrix hazakensis]
MSTVFEFTIDAECSESWARAGTLRTPHGTIRTPIFMPVGTQATVKSVSPEELKAVGAQIILSNTYHLMLRPGSQLIDTFGGLHSFMHWDGPILTDSGGFQVWSLGHLRKLNEDGVTFKSHLDGSYHTLTPERVMQIEAEIGADIILPLDICAPYPCPPQEARKAMEQTHRWEERALIEKERQRPEQALFGIVQGAFEPELRSESARIIGSMPFTGFSIGGLSVGEPKATMWEMLRYVTPELPREKPRHLLGVGSPEDLVMGVGLGMDMFDCVLPTRVARHGGLFTRSGRISIKAARYRTATGPIEEGCDCYTCRNYSAAYVHHLLRAEEQLYYRLGTIHNLRFMLRLAAELREAIITGNYIAYRDEFLERYKPASEAVREQQREKWKAAARARQAQG